MKKVSPPRKAGLRAAVSAMFRSREFIETLGKDLHHLSLAAFVSAAAVTFPTVGVSHWQYGALVAFVGVVLYLASATIAFLLGGKDDDEPTR